MLAFYYKTKIGKLGIVTEGGFVIRVLLPSDNVSDYPIKQTSLHKKAYNQIKKYLNGDLKEFKLPIKLKSTPFVTKVLKEVQRVKFGSTASYKDIAIRIKKGKACRAVGMANNKNPLPIIIPCHRVVGSDGALVGYRGGLKLKKWLLRLEGITL